MTEYKLPNGDKLEVGKCYRTRGGRKAFIWRIDASRDFPISVAITELSYTRSSKLNGCALSSEKEDQDDLISLWEDEPKRLVVTDEMLQKYLEAWFKSAETWGCDDMYRKSVKAALQAVFDHISDEGKTVMSKKTDKIDTSKERVEDSDTSEELSEDEYKIMGLEAELDILVEQILRANDLEKLKEVTRKNFPKHSKEEKPNDGWIECNCNNPHIQATWQRGVYSGDKCKNCGNSVPDEFSLRTVDQFEITIRLANCLKNWLLLNEEQFKSKYPQYDCCKNYIPPPKKLSELKYLNDKWLINRFMPYFGNKCRKELKFFLENWEPRAIPEPKEEKKEPQKQTLLEFMDERSGYRGELLPREAMARRAIYADISDYLDQK